MLSFSSRDCRYRSPFGAVADHTPVHFRICLPRTLGCRGAFLVVCRDGAMDEYHGMFWAGMEQQDHEWWECHFTPETPDLYWYGFALETDCGKRYLSLEREGRAQITDSLHRRWQLTCYDRNFKTPDWLAGGVMYQVFPDRFYRSNAQKTDVPTDRVVHSDWGEEVVWRPDETGTVRNNDFFGGDLQGIRQRLPYLHDLGVTCLYLNPIFESHSNHRYDTADYRKIDPMLGTEQDLKDLTADAKEYGIRVLLDGVFSHTGADSVYFNKDGRYGNGGAYRDPHSPYRAWYHFRNWPHDYAGWWGFPTLPEVEEQDPAFLSYITGANGVLDKWLSCGIAGWRLDVADELPDAFLEALRSRVKTQDPDALVLGEVWEDASNKHSYGHRRRYLLGEQLDSVMNYPFREAILDFVRYGDAALFFDRILTVLENYPPQVTRLLMNSLGTHDTERAMTMLVAEPTNGRGRNWQAEQRLSDPQREHGKRLLKLAGALQYFVSGVPCLYYGDEAGMDGYRDPFNRRTYPWGAEDADLVNWFRQLGRIRGNASALKEGSLDVLYAEQNVAAFTRTDERESVLCAVNPVGEERVVPLGEEWFSAEKLLGDGYLQNGLLHLPPYSCLVAERSLKKTEKK